MTLWLGLTCPTCGETRDLSADDRAKLKAKHPVQCGNGHRFRREDGFLNWLLDKNWFGGALMSADSAFEGEIDILTGRPARSRLIGRGPSLEYRLPREMRSPKVCWREPYQWNEGRALFHLTVSGDRVLAVPLGKTQRLSGSLQFQIVETTHPDNLPGWRQVLAEASVAFEQGRHNVAALLGNVAFETFYSSIADPILIGRGMPENVVQLIHVRMPLENRLEHGFAHLLGLPCLNDAPFWSEWKRKSRQCRNSLAHRWVFDQSRKRAQATRDDARWLLFYHLKALCHLDPQCFDWLLKLEAKKMTPR
jgi:hypothetical protein